MYYQPAASRLTPPKTGTLVNRMITRKGVGNGPGRLRVPISGQPLEGRKEASIRKRKPPSERVPLFPGFPKMSKLPTEGYPDRSQPASSKTGWFTRHRRTWYLAGAGLAVVGLLLLGNYRRQWYNHRRFQEVRPGVLYRTGLPSEAGFRQIVQQYGIRTVICLLEDPPPRLRAGWFFDPGQPSGPPEDQFLQQLGVRFLHWPMPNKGPWPWPKPEYLEEFFRVMDEPGNWPVLVHCWAGKHRTGTLVALFRLEYEGWPVEQALEEMYRFDFKAPFALQEHNLRTYVRRPRPSCRQWQALQEAFSPVLSTEAADYDRLVQALRHEGHQPAVVARLEEYLRQGRPFGVCLADRLLEGVPQGARAAPATSSWGMGGTDRLLHGQVPCWLPTALQLAEKIVFPGQNQASPKQDQATAGLSGADSDRIVRQQEALPEEAADFDELAAAGGLLADYGSSEVRRRLWESFRAEMQQEEITPRYRALVAGLINRYRPSRLPYLKLLLEDRRGRPEPEAGGTRYADTAVARLAAIVQEDFIGRRGQASRQDWDQAIRRAQQWFAEHPEAGKIP